MMMRQVDRFKFFGLGSLAGILLVIFFFGKKSSCTDYVSNYLPNGRVLAELRFRDKNYSKEALQAMQNMGIDTAFIHQKVLFDAEVDFDASEPRKEPCGVFILNYTDSISPLKMQVEKCPDGVFVKKITALKK